MPRRRASDSVTGQARLAEAFFRLQRERAALTAAMMQLRDNSAGRLPGAVLGVIVALLRLQRSNLTVAAMLDVDSPG